jgi:hypothetical protein
MIAFTIVFRPGITATDLRARNTRKTRRAEKLPYKFKILIQTV